MSSTFADLGVSKAVAGALRDRGFSTPFPIQAMVVPDVLSGHDVLVKSPTGSGKTLAFGVPMADRLERDGAWPSALILAPTRELAAQIVDELAGVMHARGLRITAVYGGVGIHNQAKQAGRANVLVATPGRLLDLIDRRAVALDQIELLVLDEADRMLDMGFKPVVDRIVRMTPRRAPDAALLRDPRRRGGPHRRGLHARRGAPRPHAGAREGRPHRAPLQARGARGQGLGARARAGRSQARAHARLRPHQARRRPAGQAARGARRAGRGHARRQVAVPAREGARPLRGRAGRHPGGHRRGGPRDRRRRHHPRDQLRRPGGAGGLHPPHRPHRAGRRERRRHHVRARGPGARRGQVRGRAGPGARPRRGPARGGRPTAAGGRRSYRPRGRRR